MLLISATLLACRVSDGARVGAAFGPSERQRTGSMLVSTVTIGAPPSRRAS
ncbi:hypothetical protein [Micromonospora parathelypteridis]|uniref:Uncharacterized protein n=1 Tax=Micromonospora parathelypteridis TaxID=1839617 RepID=A0A840VKK4_9ACTN|nr:hypothetical protein [Micromonospora parathelypteridis]MBB5477483.1 hypothetical protein [Micromonospora parathelypteridis]